MAFFNFPSYFTFVYLKIIPTTKGTNTFQEITLGVADIPPSCVLTDTICMFSRAFQPHHQVIHWADSLICYGGYQAVPSGCLYAVMDLRHLACHRQVEGYTSPFLIIDPFFVCSAPARSAGGWGWQPDDISLSAVCMLVFMWLAVPVSPSESHWQSLRVKQGCGIQ